MPAENANEHRWAVNMIMVFVNFECVGTKKTEPVLTTMVRDNASVADFKEHLKQSFSVVGSLIFENNPLKDSATLEESGITSGSRINMRSFSPRKTLTSHPIKIKIPDTTKPIVFQVLPQAHLSNLTHMLQDKCGMPVEEQVWYKKGKLLYSNRMKQHKDSLAVNHCSHNDILEVKWLRRIHTSRGALSHTPRNLERIPPSQPGCSAASKSIFTPPSPHLITTSSAATDSKAVPTSPPSDPFLAEPNFRELFKLQGKNGKTVEVIDEIGDKWPRLAYALGIKDADVSRLENSKDNAETCCREALRIWRNRMTRKPVNWKTLYEALEEAQLVLLASKLKSVLTEGL